MRDAAGAGAAGLQRSRRQGAGAHLHRLDVRRRQSRHNPDAERRRELPRADGSRRALSRRRREDVPRRRLRRRGRRAQQDLDQALDVLFNHPNVGPFIGRQLILQLVTSNPSPAYIAAVAAVFNDNGAGVRGDLAAVMRAVLTHPEAGAVVAELGQAVGAGAVRRVAAARAQRVGDRSPVHERQGRGDGAEGVLSRLGVQLLLAGLSACAARSARPACRSADRSSRS